MLTHEDSPPSFTKTLFLKGRCVPLSGVSHNSLRTPKVLLAITAQCIKSRSTHSETWDFSKKSMCWLLPALFLLKVWWILMYPSNWHRWDKQCQLSTCFTLARNHLNKQPDTFIALACLRHSWLKGQLHIYCQGGLKLWKEINFQSYNNIK